VKEHVYKIRQDLYRTLSKIKIYVERNLGFEAEHHFRALGDLPGVEFYMVRDILLCCYALLENVDEVHKRQNPEQFQ
jgi:hypothetical protein